LSGNVLAVDVGGSKMAAALVDGRGAILRRAQEPTPAGADPDRVRDAGAGDILFAPLRAALAELAGLAFVRRVRVRRSSLGAAAGLLGAAGLVLPEPATVA
jgi:predicted NBD/HSP70 family sugar kinase